MGIMGSLYVGASGLQSNQNALNTTGHNLANVGTSGYTRQQVLLADRKYTTVGSSGISANQVGLGVSISEVRQVRDVFLDKAYRQEIGRQAFYAAMSESSSEVETLLGELDGESFSESMSEFWTSIQEFETDPSSLVYQNLVVQKAAGFLEKANSVMEGIEDYQTNINTKITNQVDRINELGKTISSLNKQIQVIESAEVENANDLRDQRNAALDELSSLANITYNEDAEGIVTVNLENIEFVTKNKSYEMGTVKDSATGFVTPVWPHAGNQEVFDFSVDVSSELNTDIGSLKALCLSRGDGIADYTDLIGLTSDQYDDTIGMSTMMNAQAELDQLVHEVVTKMNDLFSPLTTITDDSSTTYTIWDSANGAVGSDGTGPGQEVFSRVGTSRYTQTSITVGGVAQTVYVYNEEDLSDSTSLYSTGNLIINENLIEDSSMIPYKTTTGDIAYEMASTLSKAWEESGLALNPSNTEKNNFTDYYNKLVDSLAETGSVYTSVSESLETTATSVDNQRQQIVGVSSDEELSNMIRYQNGYNAASRYMNVISQMLEHLVTQLGA